MITTRGYYSVSALKKRNRSYACDSEHVVDPQTLPTTSFDTTVIYQNKFICQVNVHRKANLITCVLITLSSLLQFYWFSPPSPENKFHRVSLVGQGS